MFLTWSFVCFGSHVNLEFTSQLIAHPETDTLPLHPSKTCVHLPRLLEKASRGFLLVRSSKLYIRVGRPASSIRTKIGLRLFTTIGRLRTVYQTTAQGSPAMALLVGLVTPADETSPTVEAFKDEGNRIGWPAGTVQVYDITEVQDAHDDVQTNGGVLVAAGEMTACALQEKSPATEAKPIPIIVAYAGAVPDNADTNMMGLIGDCVTVATSHLGLLKKAKLAVTVMYDPGAHNKVTQKVLKALTNVTPLPIRPVDMQNITAAHLNTPV
jgi:hypothetical protein